MRTGGHSDTKRRSGFAVLLGNIAVGVIRQRRLVGVL
jgi:hypothetical protein